MVKRPVESKVYAPERGDAVWINLNPVSGHEQGGFRPALILSPRAYNTKVGLALMCPITNQIKGYPYEVLAPLGLPVTGVILADQIKSLDRRGRAAAKICAVPRETLGEVLAKLATLLPGIA
jgi:mRNA interferase MazF